MFACFIFVLMPTPLNIFIIDDHQIMNDGLTQILESRPGFVVTKTFKSGYELLEALNFQKPHLIISDISMPDMSGIELAAQVLKNHKEIKIMFLSMHKEPEFVRPAIASGAHGYVLKDSKAEELFEAIDFIMNDGRYISPKASSGLVISWQNKIELTPREIEVINEIAKGKTTKEIAESLFISTHTVETHRKNLLSKTESANTAELIVWGVSEGIIETKKSRN